MTAQPDATPERSTTRGLGRWMRIVGGFYVLLGVGFVPAVNEARFEAFLPSFDAPRDSVAFAALIDWTFVFGIDTAVIGVVLLWASREAHRHLILVWLVVALELTRGVAWDVYYLTRDYVEAVGLYVGFIVVHLLIVGSGVVLARRASGGGTGRSVEA